MPKQHNDLLQGTLDVAQAFVVVHEQVILQLHGREPLRIVFVVSRLTAQLGVDALLLALLTLPQGKNLLP